MHYYIIEGPDYTGKTTALKAVATILKEANFPVLVTAHPGATPLGQLVRKLTKNPACVAPDIELDEETVQLLMVVDHLAFINTVLKPLQSTNTIILADRCNLISGTAYGLAGGVDCNSLVKMLSILNPPKAKNIYVLNASPETILKRVQSRASTTPDRFDDKGIEYFKAVASYYRDAFDEGTAMNSAVMRAGSAVKSIDAELTTQEIADQIVQDILQTL